MLQDLRFALRLLATHPWFAASAVFMVAVGIGLNAMTFTLVNAIAIRGLPFPESDKLYVLALQNRDARSMPLARGELDEVRIRTRSFSGLAGFRAVDVSVSDDRGNPERVSAARLTANAFGVLRQRPFLGRDFNPDDERRGADPVVILGYRLWKNRYGGDPAVLGRMLRLNGQPAMMVGVMPDGMQFPATSELWTTSVSPDPVEERWRVFTVFGRLSPGIGRREAQSDLDAMAFGLAAAHPDAKDFDRLRLQTFNERFSGGDVRTYFLAMWGAVGFVLLIACANVANLLLSRSGQRAREVSVRLALGATRGRVIRQFLVESVLLGLTGGTVGLLFTVIGVRVFDAVSFGPLKPYWIEFRIDYVVVAYLVTLCVGTGILFGLAPALQVSGPNLDRFLKEGGSGSVGARRSTRIAGTIVVVEVAVTLMLLAGAGLMVRSFLKLYSIDLGYGAENLMTVRLELLSNKYRSTEVRRTFYDDLVQHVRTIPGVEKVALTTSVPPAGAPGVFFEIEGRPATTAAENPPEALSVAISPDFFDVLNLRVRAGRAFTVTDGVRGEETVLINERLAQRYFTGQNPIGQRIRWKWRVSRSEWRSGGWRQIVGISPTLQHRWPDGADLVIYTPHRQEVEPGITLLVRSQAEPEMIMRAVQRQVLMLDQDQPVFTAQTIEQMLARRRRTFFAFGSLLVVFAITGVLMAAVGVYAVMSYSVIQRTREIAVRMALGADARQVCWLVLRRALIQLGIGVVVGNLGAFATTRLVRALLVQVTPTDSLTLVSMTLLLAGVAIAACLIPARRATHTEVLTALRAE